MLENKEVNEFVKTFLLLAGTELCGTSKKDELEKEQLYWLYQAISVILLVYKDRIDKKKPDEFDLDNIFKEVYNILDQNK